MVYSIRMELLNILVILSQGGCMKTIGEVINEYKAALESGNEGAVLMNRAIQINSMNCSDEDKARCFKQEVDLIICGYMGKKDNQ